MEQKTSSSERIYRLYAEYEGRGLDTTPIRSALKAATGTMGVGNIMVVSKWLDEIQQNHASPF